MNIIDSLKPHFKAFDLAKHAIGIGVIGSESHGTKIPPADGGIDDTDFMGVVVPPEKNLIGLESWEHWVYGPDEEGLDVVLYSLKKFVGLLLKSNPNVLGFLWLQPEFYVHRSSALNLLIDNRDVFSSLHAYNSFVGYAHAQLKKMEANVFKGFMGDKRKQLVEKFGYDPKNASHLIRIQRTGIEFMNTGRINVFREDAEELMEIKRGGWSLAKVKLESTRLFRESEAARVRSKLPPEPDYARAEIILMDITRRSMEGRLSTCIGRGGIKAPFCCGPCYRASV